MPSIRSLASKYYAYAVSLILLLNMIMPICFYYAVKGLVYIVIMAFFSY